MGSSNFLPADIAPKPTDRNGARESNHIAVRLRGYGAQHKTGMSLLLLESRFDSPSTRICLTVELFCQGQFSQKDFASSTNTRMIASQVAATLTNCKINPIISAIIRISLFYSYDQCRDRKVKEIRNPLQILGRSCQRLFFKHHASGAWF